jgi:hypothetical protein
MHTSVLARLKALGCRCPWGWIPFSQRRDADAPRACPGHRHPLVLLLLAVLAMEHWRDQLPTWLQRLAEHPSWLWNTGIGLIIGLSLLRWLLQR